MNQRIVLQPLIGGLTAATSQEVRFSLPSRGAKSGLVWVNVHKNTATVAVTWTILGASSRNLLDPPTGSNSFWQSTGTAQAGAGAMGAQKGTLSNIPDFLRWSMSVATGGVVDFEIVLYLFDT